MSDIDVDEWEDEETHTERLERLGTDPRKWAREFVERYRNGQYVEVDEDSMVTWFTNVLGVGEALGRYLESEVAREPQDTTTITPDLVNHPPHYRGPAGIECIQVTEHMNFCLGNTVKYVWRVAFGGKDDDLEDLKKARWYLDREITHREEVQR